MTPQAQQTAIAEILGWKFLPDGKVLSPKPIWGSPPLLFAPLPDCNDLNVLREIEVALDYNKYAEWLARVVRRDNVGAPLDSYYHWSEEAAVPGLIMATAAQRCEAVLRTLNLWKP